MLGGFFVLLAHFVCCNAIFYTSSTTFLVFTYSVSLHRPHWTTWQRGLLRSSQSIDIINHWIINFCWWRWYFTHTHTRARSHVAPYSMNIKWCDYSIKKNESHLATNKQSQQTKISYTYTHVHCFFSLTLLAFIGYTPLLRSM